MKISVARTSSAGDERMTCSATRSESGVWKWGNMINNNNLDRDRSGEGDISASDIQCP